jgi:hypothetical protein
MEKDKEKKGARRRREEIPISFEMVPRGELPKKISPSSQRWLDLIQECIKQPDMAAHVRMEGAEDVTDEVRTARYRVWSRGMMSSINGFANRHPHVMGSWRIRTRAVDFGVAVWVEPAKGA